MFLKSHKWVMVPSTRTERRWTLNVHESKRTASEIGRQYFDIDTGKFILDKMQAIKPIPWSDFYDEHYDDNHMPALWSDENRYLPAIPKFVPKDNDFDEECRRDELIKIEKERKHAKEIEQAKQKSIALQKKIGITQVHPPETRREVYTGIAGQSANICHHSGVWRLIGILEPKTIYLDCNIECLNKER